MNNTLIAAGALGAIDFALDKNLLRAGIIALSAYALISWACSATSTPSRR
jgi:hypothetical protein